MSNLFKNSLSAYLKNILRPFIVPFILTSCAGGYASHFDCPDASGYDCMSIDEVDKKITSGEIEELEERRKLKACKGRNCKKRLGLEKRPNLKDVNPNNIEFLKDFED
jgi:hypothetical protein